MKLTFLTLTAFSQIFFISKASAAYLSIGESGELIPQGTYQLGAAPQLVTNGDGGFNIAAFLDAAWTDSLSSRFVLGSGEVDFYVSGSAKFIPFPDFARQPAMGLKLSLWYAREGSTHINTLQAAPMLSKKYQSEYGELIPYAAYGLSQSSVSGDSDSGQQFFIGTDWKNPSFKNANFTFEWASSLQDSTSSISFFASFPFDDKKGFGSR